MTVQFVCDACGSTDTIPGGVRCSCGEPYWVDTDPTDFEWPEAGERSLWRYRALLPSIPQDHIGGGAGGTPLVRLPRLDDEVGGARVHVKYEGSNPTGTFKDRGSAVGIVGACADGAAAIGTVSHGNMARSVAAHAASAGFDCVVCVPADIPAERLTDIARHGPTIVRVAGEYSCLYEETLRVGPKHEIRFVNSDTPLRVAGQKTATLEILESFAPETPDAIVVPTSSGGHASAAWKAIREATAAGLLDTPPELYLAQAAQCAPIAEAYARGDSEVSPVRGGETVAYSIANPDPPSGNRALRAARATGGGALALEDKAILDARRTLSELAGLFVETSSATSLATARDLAADGQLGPDDDVVLVATGMGYTERSVGETTTVDPISTSLDNLDDTFAEMTSDR